jgi:hypothetical protein
MRSDLRVNGRMRELTRVGSRLSQSPENRETVLKQP